MPSRSLGPPGWIAIAHADIKRMRVAEAQYAKPITVVVVVLVAVLGLGLWAVHDSR
jgi:hypothetical protein